MRKTQREKKLVLTYMRQWNHRKCSPQTTKGRRVKDKIGTKNNKQKTVIKMADTDPITIITLNVNGQKTQPNYMLSIRNPLQI